MKYIIEIYTPVNTNYIPCKDEHEVLVQMKDVVEKLGDPCSVTTDTISFAGKNTIKIFRTNGAIPFYVLNAWAKAEDLLNN